MRKRPVTDRWIGYAQVNREHVAMSPQRFRDLVRERAFGEPMREGRRWIVRESGVRRYLKDGCRPMRKLVEQRDLKKIEQRRGCVGEITARAGGSAAPSTEQYATTSDAFAETITTTGGRHEHQTG